MANSTTDEQATQQGPTPQSKADRGNTDEDSSNIPWKKAALFGAAAFVVGFVLVTGFVIAEGALDDTQDGIEDEDDDDISVLNVLSWLFFNTHLVDVEFDTVLGAGSIDLLSEIDEDEGLSIPVVVWRLLPVSVLTVTGYLLASRTLPATADETDGAKRGATLAAGYLPLVFLAAVIFEESAEGASIGVDLFEALLIAGLLYPAIFGAIGGYLAVRG